MGSLLFLGALAGAIVGCSAQAQAEPFLYLLAPAWFFQVFIRFWKFLRYPRAHTWPFALGLSYRQRVGLSDNVLNRKLVEFVPLALGVIAAFSISQSIALRHIAWEKCAESFAFFLIETIGCFFGLFGVIRWNLISPIASDRRGLFFSTFELGIPNMRRFTGLAGVIARKILPPCVAVLVQRQSMYLLRMDLFSLVVFPPLAIGITALLLFYIRGNFSLLGEAAALIAPFALMTDRSPIFDESSLKLSTCAYYSVHAPDRLCANACFAGLACAPFAALFLINGIIVHGAHPVFLIHAAAFLVGMVGVALVMTYRWLDSGWTSSSSAMAATILLCAILGCAIPLYGIAFPLAALVGTYFLLKRND
jgi:hypothetical protein